MMDDKPKKKSIRISDELAGLIDWAREQRPGLDLQTLARRALRRFDSAVVSDVDPKYTTSGTEYFTLIAPDLLGTSPQAFREALAAYLVPAAQSWAKHQEIDISEEQAAYVEAMKRYAAVQAKHGIIIDSQNGE